MQDKQNKELPPAGIGLRFDEIEEMIDEIFILLNTSHPTSPR